MLSSQKRGECLTLSVGKLEGLSLPLTTEQAINQYKPFTVSSEELLRTEAVHYFPGQESIFLEAVGHIIAAMDISHRIFLQQYSPWGIEAKRTLDWLVENANGAETTQLQQLGKAIRIHGGFHDYDAKERIIPSFTSEELAEVYAHTGTVPEGILPLEQMTDFLFGKALAKLPKERGLYPMRINEGLVEVIKRGYASGFYTKVVRMDDTMDVSSIPYSEAYKKELQQMKKQLYQAAALLERLELPAEQKQGLAMYIDYLRKQADASASIAENYSYSPADIAMVTAFLSASPAPIFTPIEFGSSYPDDFGLKQFISGEFGLQTEACRSYRAFANAFGNIRELENNIPYQTAIRKNLPCVPVLILDAVYRSGDVFIGSQTIAAIYDSKEKRINDEEGVVITGWRNILEEKTRLILNPMARAIMPEKTIDAYGPEFDGLLARAYIVGTLSHEQRHFIGDQMDPAEVAKQLGEHGDPIREGTAESGRIYSFPELTTEGYGSRSRENVLTFFYQSYVVDMFRHIRFGGENPYSIAAKLRLNYFVQHGAVTIDEHLKVSVNQEKMSDAARDLYALHLEIMHTGNKELADTFVKKYSIVDKSHLNLQIKGILANIQGLGIPKDITINYEIGALKAV